MNTREKRGQILRQLREKRNIRQKDIADYLEITQQAYQRYEAGTSEPSGDLLCKLADYFNVTTDYLLGRAPQADAMKMLVAQTDVSPETLVKQFEALPEEGQALMMAIIRALKETREIRYAKRKPQTVWINQHQNKAAAGFGYNLSEKDEWFEIEVMDTPEARRADFAVEVEGNSMEPDYHDGDVVLIKKDPDVPVGAVGLFVHENMGYIKERGEDCLISLNDDYPDIEGEAQCIGLVIGIAELAE